MKERTTGKISLMWKKKNQEQVLGQKGSREILRILQWEEYYTTIWTMIH